MKMVTATGSISLRLEQVRALVAASTTWQAWTRASQVTGGAAAVLAAAKSHVHLVGLPAPEDDREYTHEQLQTLRPLAIVDLYVGQERSNDGVWSNRRHVTVGYVPTGRLTLQIDADVPETHQRSFRDAKLDFTNKIGAVFGEMCALAGTDDYISIHHLYIPEDSAPTRSSDEEWQTKGDFFSVQAVIDWGL